MRAIIIGAGKIGFNIAKILVKEKYDVILIEKIEERAKVTQENLDIQVVVGNGASESILEEAGVKDADLLIAVTEVDEINMIACVLAKNHGVEKTVARVRKLEYAEEGRVKKGLFSQIDLVINPELVTAKEIAKLIDIPEALDVIYYAEGKIQLLELKLTEDAPVAHKSIKDLSYVYPFLIVAIARNNVMIIPRGSDMLQPNDIIFILAKTKEMILIEKFLGKKRKKAESVMVFGGGYTGYHLAKMLESRKYSVKIIEKEYNKCVDIAKSLNNAMVLYGDATDIDFLTTEGVAEADVFVCLTNDDKLNLLVSLIVKNLGANRTVAQVRRSDYITMMENVGVDVGISPRILTANAILKFIHKGNNIISATLVSNESAEMLELVITEKSKVANKKLADLNVPVGSLVGSIYRKNQVIIPKGEDALEPGDVITVFVLPQSLNQVLDYFA
ncbi:MAG: Trk system potassium transporter TrkA [Clostridia bacterium]|nr:Trk system potassium transporter TrkA [Clostridia bacterium]